MTTQDPDAKRQRVIASDEPLYAQNLDGSRTRLGDRVTVTVTVTEDEE